MAGDGRPAKGVIRITFDMPTDDEKAIRIWAAETDRNRGQVIREEMTKLINRRKKAKK